MFAYFCLFSGETDNNGTLKGIYKWIWICQICRYYL